MRTEAPAIDGQRRHISAFPKSNLSNPYNDLLYTALGSRGWTVTEFSFRDCLAHQVSHIHLHWPEAELQRGSAVKTILLHVRLFTCLSLARIRGIRVIWTVHNIGAHDGKGEWRSRLFRAWYPRIVTAWIALSEHARKIAVEAYPGLASKPHGIAYHGHYRTWYEQPAADTNAPRNTGIQASRHGPISVGYLGTIRPYKNVTGLIRAFRSLSAPNTRLTIKGKPWNESLLHEILALANGDPSIAVRPHELPDREIPKFFDEIDLFVLPHNRVLNSGGLLLSLSFNVPVLAPRQGSLPEVAGIVGPDWVFLYDGEMTGKVINDALCWLRTRPQGGRCDLSVFDWDRVAADTEKIMLP